VGPTICIRVSWRLTNRRIGILLAIEPTETVYEAPAVTMEVVLPSVSSISDLWPESQQFIALPQGLQRSLPSLSHAVYAGFCLLGAIIPRCLGTRRLSVNSAALESLRPWALETCLSLWDNFGKWEFSANKEPLHDEISAMYMQSLEMLAFPRLDAMDDFSSTTKAAIPFITGLINAVPSNLSTALSDSNQTRLALLLNRLRSTLDSTVGDHQKSNLRNVIIEIMTPAVTDICQNSSRVDHIHRDLQVCTHKHV